MYLRIFEYLQGTQAQNAGIPLDYFRFRVPEGREKILAKYTKLRATLAKLPSVLSWKMAGVSFLTPFPLLRAP